MVIPDANILIYSQNPGAIQHQRARSWLEQLFKKGEPIGLTWLTLWAFIRVASNIRLWRDPVSVEDLFDRIAEWQLWPNVILVDPGPRHRHLLKSLMLGSGVTGAASMDAVLAAIAIENAATLASTDRDFRRFSGLRWVNPLEND